MALVFRIEKKLMSDTYMPWASSMNCHMLIQLFNEMNSPEILFPTRENHIFFQEICEAMLQCTIV